MERPHLMIGLIAGIACFTAAIWTGLDLREMTIGASERLNAMPVDELARAMSGFHRTNQVVLWHYVPMIGFTVAGIVVSGIVLIAWWGSRIVARHPVGHDPKDRSGIAPPPQRSSKSMQIGGKRYLVR
ncbi:MAG: hypothetical protein B7Z15_00030 [Rhizobiales bacterium 32-66-8]|nr:MAG: hypothetical protein B7Z15_00030 [Rhizobiales bacterium 32-66-8]